MADILEIKASTRETIGKANRRLGAEKLAAVVYGHGSTATPIALDRHDFELVASHDEALSSKVIHLVVDEHKPVNVIVKDIQRDPIKGAVEHVDFWAIRMSKPIQTTVALHFEGEAPGVKTGGVMMHNIQGLSIESLPADLPEAIVVDVSGLHVGDSVHVSDLEIPKGVTVLDPPEEIIASVVPPAKSIEEEVAEAAAAVEPTLIGEETEEGE